MFSEHLYIRTSTVGCFWKSTVTVYPYKLWMCNCLIACFLLIIGKCYFYLGCWVYLFLCQNGFRIAYQMVIVKWKYDWNCFQNEQQHTLLVVVLMLVKAYAVERKCFINWKDIKFFLLIECFSQDSNFGIHDSFVLAPLRKINLMN